jgi:hypothetical protein
MSKKQTIEHVVNGYFGKPPSLPFRYTTEVNSELALAVVFKVNSAKQAQERFLKKFESLLSGYWRFEIRRTGGKVLLEFIRQEDGTIAKTTDTDEVPF